MTLQDLRDLLVAAGAAFGIPAFHYEAQNQSGPYLVWAEDGEAESLSAGDRTAVRVMTGTADLFTRTEFDPAVSAVERALDACPDLSWSLNSVQKERETGYIHYEWRWEMVSGWDP